MIILSWKARWTPSSRKGRHSSTASLNRKDVHKQLPTQGKRIVIRPCFFVVVGVSSHRQVGYHRYKWSDLLWQKKMKQFTAKKCNSGIFLLRPLWITSKLKVRSLQPSKKNIKVLPHIFTCFITFIDPDFLVALLNPCTSVTVPAVAYFSLNNYNHARLWN